MLIDFGQASAAIWHRHNTIYRCHCMKVEKVAKLHLWLHLKTPKLHAPSLTGVFQEHIIYSLCAPKLHWSSDEFQWHTAREAMRYQPCNHVNVLSVHSANGAKSLESMVLKIPRADSFAQQAKPLYRHIGMLLTPGKISK